MKAKPNNKAATLSWPDPYAYDMEQRVAAAEVSTVFLSTTK